MSKKSKSLSEEIFFFTCVGGLLCIIVLPFVVTILTNDGSFLPLSLPYNSIFARLNQIDLL